MSTGPMHLEWRNVEKFVNGIFHNSQEENYLKFRCVGNPKDNQGVRVNITLGDCKYAYDVTRYGDIKRSGLDVSVGVNITLGDCKYAYDVTRYGDIKRSGLGKCD